MSSLMPRCEVCDEAWPHTVPWHVCPASGAPGAKQAEEDAAAVEWVSIRLQELELLEAATHAAEAWRDAPIGEHIAAATAMCDALADLRNFREAHR